MQANRQKASIVFNLHPHQLLGLLPEAFIVSHKKDGSLGYILQRASLETIGSYQLECTAVCKKLIAALDTWQEQTLEDKFNAKKGRRKKLAQLWEDKKIKKQIRSYLDKHLHAFYQEVRTYQPLLTKGLERRAYVPDFLVRIVKETLEPHLYFQRSSEHMRYIFSVWRKGRKIRIPQGRVHTLVNEPAWVIWDDHLVQIAHINGLMVRPFWNKQEVIVPTRSMKRYFEQFVVKVAAKVDLEVKGFEVKKYSSIQKAVLRVADNFLSRELQIQLQFYYDSATFGWNDKQAQHTRLVFGTDESIVIHRVVRDQVQEQTYVQKLLELGLTTNNTAFQLEVVDDDAHELLAWFIQHQQELVDLGFELTAPQIQQKAIQLVAGELTANISKGNDWFDLDGRVQIGETSVSFHLLFPYIRANDSFYPLADGTYFLIPKAWMNRYKLLAERGKRQGTKMRFPRSLQHMLKDFSEIEKTADTPDEVLAAVADYKPSKHLKASLRPYQLAGVKWLVQHYYNGFGACLADDMGLGKTLQTISVLLHAKENLPKRKQAPQPKQLGLFENTVVGDYYDALQALVILPASLVFNWRQELKKFAPHLQVLNYTGAKRKVHQKLLHRFDLILTTYQTARQDVAILKDYEFSYLILDESQYIKNRTSKIFKAINSLQAQHKISLSGTPIENSLADLWSQMQFINPDILGSYTSFKKHYQMPIEQQDDEHKKATLRQIIQPYLLRRTKEAVAKDLPVLSVQICYSEMGAAQQKVYDREKSAARNYLLENYQNGSLQYYAKVLQSLTKLRQIADHPVLCQADYMGTSAKFQDVLEQLNRIRKSGHKALVFSAFTAYLALFKEYFKAHQIPFSQLQGDNSQQQRQRAVLNFQQRADIQIFLISLKAGGTGLNLTAADYVFILDPWWNPQTEQQAIARAHRIGQDKKVFATKFIVKDSIEEKILQLQARKSRLAEDIVVNGQPKKFDRDEIRYLFE